MFYCFTAILHQISSRVDTIVEMHIAELKYCIQAVTNKVDRILIAVNSKENEVVNSSSFEKKHQVNLPASSFEEFDKLNMVLKTEEATADFVSKISTYFFLNFVYFKKFNFTGFCRKIF